jgi:hypothetical protein
MREARAWQTARKSRDTTRGSQRYVLTLSPDLSPLRRTQTRGSTSSCRELTVRKVVLTIHSDAGQGRCAQANSAPAVERVRLQVAGTSSQTCRGATHGQSVAEKQMFPTRSGSGDTSYRRAGVDRSRKTARGPHL